MGFTCLKGWGGGEGGKGRKISNRGHVSSTDSNIFYLAFYINCLYQSLIQTLTCMLPADRGLTNCNMGNLIL